MILFHVGHDNALHHWLPGLIAAAAIATVVVFWKRHRMAKESRRG